MMTFAAAGVAMLGMAAATAEARHYSTSRGFTDTARVTHVEPIYRTVTTTRPVRECSEEEVYRPVSYDEGYGDSGNTALGMIVGGVLGGALGHNISRHGDNGKIVGAVVGSAIGHEVAQRNRGRHGRYQDYRPRWEERCHTVSERYTEEKLDGYRVTYRYHGQSFTTRMDRDPGSRIKVRVRVTPVY